MLYDPLNFFYQKGRKTFHSMSLVKNDEASLPFFKHRKLSVKNRIEKEKPYYSMEETCS